jgi:gliding motility-associated-like protein
MKNAYAADCKCFGGEGSINFEFENVEDGTYVIVYIGGEFTDVQVTNGLATVPAKAGSYEVLAIVANGCNSAEKHSVTILEPPRLSVSAKITEIDLKSGQKGEIDLTITGGTPTPTKSYQVVWEPNLEKGFSGATTEDIKNLNDGDYTANITDQNGCPITYLGTIPMANQPPVATNDDYKAECGGKAGGDLLKTDTGFGIDSDPDGDDIFIDTTTIQKPAHGIVTINLDGTFVYYANLGFTGVDEFQYVIYDVKKNFSTPATVTIHVVADFDGDGVVDEIDPDADGDGILNIDEVLAGLDWTKTDSDGDGHPNWLDIDSDNDGIVDNIEAQTSARYIPPTGIDSDHDGVDNAYDTSMGNENIKPLDTDGDGIPDFLDSDSDNDLVPDYTEGHDKNSDGKPDEILLGLDSDFDGLDDGFDTVPNNCNNFNSTGSNSPLQDFDHDGMHDWRDDNDDNDEYPTRFEDLNADGNYSNDDTDGDGYPEYLDFGRDCELLIPEAFSPNEDNIHEYFQIYCIESFPDAKIYIFDQFGNLLFEKEHYGNLNVWNSPENAWWDGRTKNRSATTINGKVTPGTYFYVLKLGNGEVKKSFVFVSY